MLVPSKRLPNQTIVSLVMTELILVVRSKPNQFVRIGRQRFYSADIKTISHGRALNAIAALYVKQIIMCCCPKAHKCWQKEDLGKKQEIDKYLNNI